MAQNSMYNDKSRHIHCIHNIVKHFFSNGSIFIDYVNSKKNITDPLTKGLSREFVYNSSMGIYFKHLKIKKSVMIVIIPS
jgi:hypothetical protein